MLSLSPGGEKEQNFLCTLRPSTMDRATAGHFIPMENPHELGGSSTTLSLNGIAIECFLFPSQPSSFIAQSSILLRKRGTRRNCSSVSEFGPRLPVCILLIPPSDATAPTSHEPSLWCSNYRQREHPNLIRPKLTPLQCPNYVGNESIRTSPGGQHLK